MKVKKYTKRHNIQTNLESIHKNNLRLSISWWPNFNYHIMMLKMKLPDYDVNTLPARSCCWHCIRQSMMFTPHLSGYNAQNCIYLIIMQESELSLTQCTCQIIIPTLDMPDHMDHTATAKSWYLNWNCLIMIPSSHLPNNDVNY